MRQRGEIRHQSTEKSARGSPAAAPFNYSQNRICITCYTNGEKKAGRRDSFGNPAADVGGLQKPKEITCYTFRAKKSEKEANRQRLRAQIEGAKAARTL